MTRARSNFTHPRPGAYSRSMRLTHALEFQAVYGFRLRKTAPPLVVFFRPNDRRVNRLGLSVSRRHGAAVERNRWKRSIRDAFRTVTAALSGPEGECVDLVVQVGSGASQGDSAALEAALLQAAAAAWREILRRRRRSEPDPKPANDEPQV